MSRCGVTSETSQALRIHIALFVVVFVATWAVLDRLVRR